MIAKKLLLLNIAPGTSDEELVALVKKYAPELECIGMTRLDADGSRPGALLSFMHGKIDSLENLGQRLGGMYWKGRRLSATILLE